MLRESGYCLGLGETDGSLWMHCVYFFVGFQSGPTKVVEGITLEAYFK
jgi:hypothetical protein